jgi:hypothetical protein
MAVLVSGGINLAKMITSRKIKLIRFDVVRVTFGQAILLFTAQSQGVCYFLRDYILNGENIREFFIERARPKRNSVCHLD